MNKDCMYVLDQPKHAIASIIFVRTDFIIPVLELVHKNLDNLGLISDLIFIFSDKYEKLKENKQKKVNPRKFSNLYRACSFFCGSKSVVPEPLLEVLLYCQEVFNHHAAYIITDTLKLGDIELTEKALSNIQVVAMSEIKRPVIEIDRLSADELGEIYYMRNQTNWIKLFRESRRGCGDREFTTHSSDSPLVFLKSYAAEQILREYKENKEDFLNNYLLSFSEADFLYFLASYIMRLELGMIPNTVTNLIVNDLRGNK